MRELRANKGQLQAIFHENGPARVIAGPGSGKTFTIIQRVLHLIKECDIPPNQILTITFTKAAAIEMKDRYHKQISENPDFKFMNGVPCFGTLHSLGYQILRDSGYVHGYILTSEQKKRNIIEQLLKNAGYASICDFDTMLLILAHISKKKNGCFDASFESLLPEEVFHNLILQYDEFMKEQKLLDFDDMILLCIQRLREDSKLLSRWQQKFQYIQVDEFQDVNEKQYELICLLSKNHHNVFVVGDDDQAIYGFRGSSPSIMEKFLLDYPKAVQIALCENYRCREKIVCLASEVIAQNKYRIHKEIVPREQDGEIMYYQAKTKKEEMEKLVTDLRTLSLEEQFHSAIILRTNREAALYQEFLKTHQIPVAMKKKREDLMSHFIVEDFKSFLLLIQDGFHREHLLKIWNKPQRYLTSKALIHEMVTEKELLLYYQNNKEMCDKIHRLFQGFERTKSMSFYLAIRYFRKVLGYDLYLQEKGDHVRLLQKADQIQELLKQRKEGESITDFIERQEKETNHNLEDGMIEGVTIMTMHSSKGLEFQNVFLPDLNEGMIPSRGARDEMAVEEERRLLYVAITRAKDRLYLYDNRDRNRKQTRFLNGIIPRQ